MLISYNWLRELTATSVAPRELAARLTMVGLAVDGVREVGDDYVLEFDITSNRPDCLSHLGVAREVAVMERGSVHSPEAELKTVAAGRAEDFTGVEVREAELCPRYAARVVRGVRVRPSPEWIVKRLEAVGLRAINNVTDITNLVLHEQGQPLHAFDLAKLDRRKIIVRRAEAGERIVTLDGVERELDAEMLVIADAARPVAIAGVMGGAETAVYDETQDVLIESAYFESSQVRRTARALDLHTDASHRFERGTDPEAVLRAQARAVALICEIAGGASVEDATDIRLKDFTQPVVNFRPRRFENLTGLRVDTREAVRILHALGFTPHEEMADDGGTISREGVSEIAPDESGIAFRAPTWRVDIEREEDLIEEVARHTGYDRIATKLPASSVAGEYRAGEERVRAARRALVGCGYTEAINFSFIDAGGDDRFQLLPSLGVGEEGNAGGFVSLDNPIIEGAARMRPTLLAGLLEAARHNFNHGTRDVRLFETGRIFARASSEDETKNRPRERDALAIRERDALAIIATGGALEANVAVARRELDFYDLKGALEAMAEAMNARSLSFEAADDVRHLRAGQAARILLDGAVVGTIGLLADTLAQAYKFRQRVFVAEVDFDSLIAAQAGASRYVPLARFPSVVRDASFITNRRVAFDRVRRAVLDLNLDNCRRVELVDVYEGGNLPEDTRSITLRVEYRADDRTLRDEEVDEMQSRVVSALEQNFNAKIRGQ